MALLQIHQGAPSQRSNKGWEHARRQRLMATSRVSPMTSDLKLSWEPWSVLKRTGTTQPFHIAANCPVFKATTIWWHCCKFTFSDGKNRMLASEPERSSKDRNVPAFRYYWKLHCIDGNQDMIALLRFHFYWWQEQNGATDCPVLMGRTIWWPGCKFIFSDGRNKMMASETDRSSTVNWWQEQCDVIIANLLIGIAEISGRTDWNRRTLV